MSRRAAATRSPARRPRTLVPKQSRRPARRPPVGAELHRRLFALLAAAVAAASAGAAFAQGRTPVVPGAHDALAVAGPQAAQIGELWNLTVFICTAVFCAILLG